MWLFWTAHQFHKSIHEGPAKGGQKQCSVAHFLLQNYTRAFYFRPTAKAILGVFLQPWPVKCDKAEGTLAQVAALFPAILAHSTGNAVHPLLSKKTPPCNFFIGNATITKPGHYLEGQETSYPDLDHFTFSLWNSSQNRAAIAFLGFDYTMWWNS